MLHGLGIETGVDLDKLVGIGHWICGVLGREPVLQGQQGALSEETA